MLSTNCSENDVIPPWGQTGNERRARTCPNQWGILKHSLNRFDTKEHLNLLFRCELGGWIGGGGSNASEDLDEKSTCLYTRAGRKPRGHKKHRAFSPREEGRGRGDCGAQ